MSQNIFDNEAFFENYRSIRNKVDNYNDMLEQPAMKMLLPDLKDKTVLDMGCGFGRNCMDFVQRGAKKVTGIDISENMLAVAKTENADENIKYMRLDIENIDKLNLKFDFIYSSLAIHYIADFNSLIEKIYNILSDDGIFLFSHEHPLATAPKAGPQWIRNGDGIKIASILSDYLENGERQWNWGMENVINYHRSFSFLINTLIENDFSIVKIVEPFPTKQVLEIAPNMYDEVHRPTSIIIKARKEKT